MAHGGKRPGAGRPKGTPNKSTAPIREAIAERDPIGRLFELAAEAKERNDPEFERDTLKAVLPYGYARLAASSVDLTALGGDVILNVNLPADEPE